MYNSIKRIATAVAIVALIMALMAPVIALGADSIINSKISNMVEKVDKNGNPYVRFIITEQRKLGGVKYKTGVPVMAFREHAQKAQTYKIGDNLKAVVKYREYQGRESYTIMAFIE